MALKRKIAHINLSKEEILIKPISMDLRRKLLGGRGMSAYLLYTHMTPESDALSPDNVIIISAGMMGGTLLTGMTLTHIAFKSPLTNCVEYAVLDGSFASEMRWAGFDYVIIQGSSKKPVNILIHDQDVKILGAGKLWGKNTTETFKKIRSTQKSRENRMLCIGPAGENLVRYANIIDDQGKTAGRTGLGAVFGSKRIKSVSCLGTLDIEIKHPEEALEWHKSLEDPFMQTECSSESGKSDLKDTLFGQWAGEQGIDLKMAKAMLSWSVLLVRKKKIPEKELIGLDLDLKNEDAVKSMIEKIVFRKGWGDVLAGGPLRASESLPEETLKYFGSIEKLTELYQENTTDPLAGKNSHKTDGETAKKIINGLGLSFSGGSSPGEHADLTFLRKLIQMNTGLKFSNKELKDIAFRSHMVERLLSIRENRGSEGTGLSQFCFEHPDGTVIPDSIQKGIDLKKYQMKINEHYRIQQMDKKNLLKLKYFKKLQINDLWPFRQKG